MISQLISPLTQSQERLLASIAEAFRANVECDAEATSDLATPLFMEDFTIRLLIYHALNADPLKKKTLSMVVLSCPFFPLEKPSPTRYSQGCRSIRAFEGGNALTDLQRPLIVVNPLRDVLKGRIS